MGEKFPYTWWPPYFLFITHLWLHGSLKVLVSNLVLSTMREWIYAIGNKNDRLNKLNQLNNIYNDNNNKKKAKAIYWTGTEYKIWGLKEIFNNMERNMKSWFHNKITLSYNPMRPSPGFKSEGGNPSLEIYENKYLKNKV